MRRIFSVMCAATLWASAVQAQDDDYRISRGMDDIAYELRRMRDDQDQGNRDIAYELRQIRHDQQFRSNMDDFAMGDSYSGSGGGYGDYSLGSSYGGGSTYFGSAVYRPSRSQYKHYYRWQRAKATRAAQQARYAARKAATE